MPRVALENGPVARRCSDRISGSRPRRLFPEYPEFPSNKGLCAAGGLRHLAEIRIRFHVALKFMSFHLYMVLKPYPIRTQKELRLVSGVHLGLLFP